MTLSHLAVPSTLANKYPGTLEHPKAVGIMQRTAELLRLWGAEDEVRRRGVAREFCERIVWTTTLSGEKLGRTETVEPDDRVPEPQSPVTGSASRSTSRSRRCASAPRAMPLPIWTTASR